jgi:hypothetical protein
VLAARPLRAGGEPLRRATLAQLSGAPEKELLTLKTFPSLFRMKLCKIFRLNHGQDQYR